MATWNFVIYAKTDFTSFDFNGTMTTGASLTPIYITIEDNDTRLDSTDGDGQQTIVSSSDPSLVGQYVNFEHPGSSPATTLVDTTGGVFHTIVNLAVGGVDDYVMALDSNVNFELTPNTTYTDTNSGNGKVFANYATTALPTCYCPGTRIQTARGAVAVEELRVGDQVQTADHGLQPVRWIGVEMHRFASGPHKHKPIEIKPGSLGYGLPRRKLVMSPQHRVLFKGPLVAQMFEEPDVFAMARGLTGLAGVRAMDGKTRATYYSVLCDQHEMILAEGVWSETFYPGPMALRMLRPEYRRAVETLFPLLRRDPEAGYGPRCRKFLSLAQTQALVTALKEHHGAGDLKLGVDPGQATLLPAGPPLLRSIG